MGCEGAELLNSNGACPPRIYAGGWDLRNNTLLNCVDFIVDIIPLTRYNMRYE